MFGLHKDAALISNINTRTEKHGDENVLACDIRIDTKAHNSVLSKFSPSLKECLYTTDPDAVQDLINPDHMPRLRNPQMGVIKWEFEMPSVQLRIHDDVDDIVFSGGKAGKFSFHCQEGGTVNVGFRVQISGPDERDLTRLLFLLQKTVRVTLINDVVDSDDDGPEPKNPSGELNFSAPEETPAQEAQEPAPSDQKADDSGDDDNYPRTKAEAEARHRQEIIARLNDEIANAEDTKARNKAQKKLDQVMAQQ